MPNPRPRHAGSGRRAQSRGLAAVREIFTVTVAALVLSLLIKTFLAQAFYIPSASMQDTLLEGDRIMVSKLTPGVFELRRGDIVVFKDPDGWLGEQPEDPSAIRRAVARVLTFVGLLPPDAGEHLIKRLVGLPGDRVACCDAAGLLTVNGAAVTEPYLKPGVAPSDHEFDVLVPEGHLWVMGDNRPNSQDSRAHLGDPGGGMVPVADVVGTAFLRVWPADRVGILARTDVFDVVPSS